MKRLIFIDTSEFKGANFNYSGPRLSTVSDRVAADHIEVGMPNLTKEEIIAGLDEATRKSKRAIANTRKEARVLKNLDNELSSALFAPFDREDIKGKLVSKLENYMAQIHVRELDYDGSDPGKIFELYFSQQAPFGEGKKKSEFPDAFALSILSEWGLSEEKTVLIASSDGDFKNGAKHFLNVEYVGNLQELLERIAYEFDELPTVAKTACKTLTNDIEQNVSEDFLNLGFVLNDQDGDVDDTRILNISLETHLLHVRALNEEETEAMFDLVATIDYEVDLSYGDQNTAIYDSEEGKLIYMETAYETVQQIDILQGELTITINTQDREVLEFSVDLYQKSDISVSSSEVDDWPYK
ncbi:MAG: PIN domain-containing protein [Sedimenticola sp.]